MEVHSRKVRLVRVDDLTLEKMEINVIIVLFAQSTTTLPSCLDRAAQLLIIIYGRKVKSSCLEKKCIGGFYQESPFFFSWNGIFMHIPLPLKFQLYDRYQTKDSPFLPLPLAQVISTYYFCSALCVPMLQWFTVYMKTCLLNKLLFLIPKSFWYFYSSRPNHGYWIL